MKTRAVTDRTTLLLTLPSGESAYFQRRTTWEKRHEESDGTNLVAIWSYLPRTEMLDLSEQSTITLCCRGQVSSITPVAFPAIT